LDVIEAYDSGHNWRLLLGSHVALLYSDNYFSRLATIRIPG